MRLKAEKNPFDIEIGSHIDSVSEKHGEAQLWVQQW